MESKVLLFNEDDTRIGETFMRRARQLVSQQRAEWTDESHSAIRFAHDEDILPPETLGTATYASDRPAAKSDKTLYALAEKRIEERKRFILHSVIILPLWAVILGGFGSSESEWEIAMFLFGCSLTLYAVHAYGFYKEFVKGYFRLKGDKERRARSLELEMDKLRRMGYAD